MLRIQRAANGKICFSLSGRMEAEDVDALRELIGLEYPRKRIVLDLRELLLVDSDAMEFLAECEAKGILLEQCPGFVRTWIDQWKTLVTAAQPSPQPASPAPFSPDTGDRKRMRHAQRRTSRNAGISNA